MLVQSGYCHLLAVARTNDGNLREANIKKLSCRAIWKAKRPVGKRWPFCFLEEENQNVVVVLSKRLGRSPFQVHRYGHDLSRFAASSLYARLMLTLSLP